MEKENNYAVILASGVGFRLWPMSTDKKPKQFLDLLGFGKTMLQFTYERLKYVVDKKNIFVVTTPNYISLVKNQLPEVKRDNIIIEPRLMNTAACNLLAAMHIYQLNKDANIIVSPSDHLIDDVNLFKENIQIALGYAKNDYLIALGAKPTNPDTNANYVQIIEEDTKPIKKLKTLIDKPNEEFANIFYTSNDFYWNTGILVWSAKTIIHAFKKYQPQMVEILDKYFSSTDKSIEILKPIYTTLDIKSINNAILERAKNVYILPTKLNWNNIASWDNVGNLLRKDFVENRIKTKKNLLYDTENTLIYSTEDKPIIIEGLKDFIVVNTEDGLIILPKNNIDQLKSYISEIRLQKRNSEKVLNKQ